MWRVVKGKRERSQKLNLTSAFRRKTQNLWSGRKRLWSFFLHPRSHHIDSFTRWNAISRWRCWESVDARVRLSCKNDGRRFAFGECYPSTVPFIISFNSSDIFLGLSWCFCHHRSKKNDFERKLEKNVYRFAVRLYLCLYQWEGLSSFIAFSLQPALCSCWLLNFSSKNFEHQLCWTPSHPSTFNKRKGTCLLLLES